MPIFIDKIFLNNFKSFYGDKTAEIKFAPRITLLFGKNSVGKSTIIEALKILQQSHENNMDLCITPPPGYAGGINYGYYKNIISQNDTSKTLTLGITVSERDLKGKKDCRLQVGDTQRTIIKKFKVTKKGTIYPETVDLYSPLDDPDNNKFVSLKNKAMAFSGMENFFSSKISFIENKHALKELWHFSVLHKRKVIRYLEETKEFAEEFLQREKKKDKKGSREMFRHYRGGRYGDRDQFGEGFRPGRWPFIPKTIDEHVKFLSKNKITLEEFIKYISKELKEKSNFLYKNNNLISWEDLEHDMEIGRMANNKKNKIKSFSKSYVTLFSFLCSVVTKICKKDRNHFYRYQGEDRDSFSWNDKRGNTKTLSASGMFRACSPYFTAALKKTIILGGQKPLPRVFTQASVNPDFVGYDFENLPSIINKNKKQINLWLEKFGYDFSVTTTSGGPMNETTIMHIKDKFKINYKFGGLGAENILPLITQCVASNNKVIVLEEPERRIHPGLQGKLGNFFTEISKKNQLIIETHSENLLLGLLKEIREKRISHNDVQISYVHMDNSQSKIDHLKLNEEAGFTTKWKDGFFSERLTLI